MDLGGPPNPQRGVTTPHLDFEIQMGGGRPPIWIPNPHGGVFRFHVSVLRGVFDPPNPQQGGTTPHLDSKSKWRVADPPFGFGIHEGYIDLMVPLVFDFGRLQRGTPPKQRAPKGLGLRTAHGDNFTPHQLELLGDQGWRKSYWL